MSDNSSGINRNQAPTMTDDPSAFDELLKWIQDHPYQTFFYIVNGVIFLYPAVATVPFFATIGVNTCGPIAGTFQSSQFQRKLRIDIVKRVPLRLS